MSARGPRYRATRGTLLAVLGINLLVAVIEGGYGLASGSVAMQADALHALLHGLGSVIGLAGVALAARAPDSSHPYGYERYEPLAALGMVGLMLLAVREIGGEAIGRLAGQTAPTVTPLSFAAVGLAVGAATSLGLWERRQARALGSAVLVADSRRILADALVSLSVGGGLLSVLAGFPMLDPLVALAIAAVIVWTGWTLLRELAAVLTDTSACDPLRIAAAACAVPGVLGAHDMRARGVAGAVRADLHVTVDPRMTVDEAHELAHRVRDRVRQDVAGISEVLVHVGVAPEHGPDDGSVAP